MRTNTKHSTVTFLADGGYSSVWNYGDGVIKITQDMTTIDFYDAILHTERVKGLPEVTEVAPNVLQALIFDIELDECSTRGKFGCKLQIYQGFQSFTRFQRLYYAKVQAIKYGHAKNSMGCLVH